MPSRYAKHRELGSWGSVKGSHEAGFQPASEPIRANPGPLQWGREETEDELTNAWGALPCIGWCASTGPKRPHYGLFWFLSLLSVASGLHLPASARLSFVESCDPFPVLPAGMRIGEAANPGPLIDLAVGSSNPSGLRNKESIALGLGYGLWSFSETQLSAVTFKTSRHLLIHQARSQSRHVRVLGRADVALRTTSTWAGAWSGVLQLSDFPCKPLHLGWPPDLQASSRIMAAQHYVGALPVVVVTVYGYSSGPTWPDALARTEELLTQVSKEVIIGLKGPCIVLGDFNHDVAKLHQCSIWQAHGWSEVQQRAQQLWGFEPRATCKHATFRDFIWVSPEIAPLLSKVEVRDMFAELGTPVASFAVPVEPIPRSIWPLPSVIPWDQVDVAAWRLAGYEFPPALQMRQHGLQSSHERLSAASMVMFRQRRPSASPPSVLVVDNEPALPMRHVLPHSSLAGQVKKTLDTTAWDRRFRDGSDSCAVCKATTMPKERPAFRPMPWAIS